MAFNAEELEKIIQGAVEMEDKLLSGERDMVQMIQKIGTPYVGEGDELGFVVEGEAFEKYEKWVQKTWKVNKTIQKWINSKLGICRESAPVIIPSGDFGLCFRCDTCGCEVEEGHVVNNNLKHSKECK